MEQNNNSNSQINKITDFLKTNKNYVIAGIIVILAIVYFGAQGSDTNSENTDMAQTSSQSTSEQGKNENKNEDGNENKNENNNGTSQATSNTNSAAANGTQQSKQTGNVAATGKLMASDNTAKGNLMIQSNRGKIYIATVRDFSNMIGKEVTLNANGTFDSFVFLGLTEGATAQPTAVAPAAPSANTKNVHFKGTLKKSGNPAKGNYVITSNAQKVYLQSGRNYSAWENQEVHLTATGTIQSFTNAVLTK